MSLTRADILKAEDLPRETINVPEWGGEVFVCTMTAQERDEFEVSILDGEKGDKISRKNIRARLAVRCLADDKGERLFTDADADALGKKSAAVLDRIFDAAQRLNALGKKDIEELRKNSEAIPAAG